VFLLFAVNTFYILMKKKKITWQSVISGWFINAVIFLKVCIMRAP